MEPGWSSRLLAVLVLAGGPPACRFHADYDDTEYLCSDGVCPAGKTCVDGHCVSGIADGGTVDGPGDIDGAVPVAACGTIGLLADDFADGVRGSQWSDAYENVVTWDETGGQLAFTIGADITGSAAYITDSTYDLRDSRVWVEVVEAGDPATEQEAQLVLRTGADDRVVMKQRNGTLEMYYRDVGVQGGLATTAYSAADHRFWQLREQGGTLYWEGSNDGVGWTVLHSLTSLPIDISKSQVQIGAAVATAGPAGTVVFDDVNGGTPASGSWCRASSFGDGFDDGLISWDWSQSFDNTGCTLAEEGGQAVIDLLTGSATHCAFYTGTTYDLRDDAVQVEVVQMLSTSLTDVRAYLRIWLDPTNNLDVLQQDGTLYFRSEAAAVDTEHATVTWSASTHRFWRIREAAGWVYWETSSDGTDWTVRAQAADPFDLSAIEIGLGGQALSTTVTEPGLLRFDRYNQP